MGIAAAVNHNKLIDQMARVFAILGHSLPSFIFALLALMVFYAKLGWFPPGRISDWANEIIRSAQWHDYTYLLTVDSLLNGRVDIFLDALRHLILPVTVLSTISWATYLRVTRSSMLETLRQEYVVTARAKGLKERDVINGHARPNALIPVATLGGFTVAGLLGGAVLTETVFNFPGIGQAAGRSGGAAGRHRSFIFYTACRFHPGCGKPGGGCDVRFPRSPRQARLAVNLRENKQI